VSVPVIVPPVVSRPLTLATSGAVSVTAPVRVLKLVTPAAPACASTYCLVAACSAVVGSAASVNGASRVPPASVIILAQRCHVPLFCARIQAGPGSAALGEGPNAI